MREREGNRNIWVGEKETGKYEQEGNKQENISRREGNRNIWAGGKETGKYEQKGRKKGKSWTGKIKTEVKVEQDCIDQKKYKTGMNGLDYNEQKRKKQY